MVYTKNTWVDDDPTKPLSAARMNNIETGIGTADANATTAIANVATAQAGVNALNNAEANPVKISVVYKTAAAGYNYAVMRAYTGGRFVPGLARKRYGSDFDTTNPTSTGAAFIPPKESLASYSRRTGSTVAVNASGWNVTSNPGEMRGIQIRNSIMYHDFESTTSGSPAGIEGLALLPTGQLICVSALRGDTGAALLAAGVTDTWCYGPNLVVNGVQQDIDSNPSFWKYFASTYSSPEISARTIIGQTQTGDIIVISTVGKTGVSGINGNAMSALAASEGMYNASLFDGGGSAQMWTQGVYTIPSSDDTTGYDSTTGQRKVPDCFLVSGLLATRAVETGWINIPLNSGYTAVSVALTPQVRQIDGNIELRGAVKPSTGNFGSADVAVGILPAQFRTNQATKAYAAIGNGSNFRKVTLAPDGTITVVGDPTSTPTNIILDAVGTRVDSW